WHCLKHSAVSNTVIGIDLKTTYSCVGAYINGQVKLIANDQGNSITPSWVIAFSDAHPQRLVGEAAKIQAARNADGTIWKNRFKLRRDIEFLHRKVVNKDGNPHIQVKPRDEEKAYFINAQRCIAGLNVIRIISEPTAAAIAYGLHKKCVMNKNILVYDLGGGTFDVSILTIDNGTFEVCATTGDSLLGGEDFDHGVVDFFIKLILKKKKYNKDISKDNKTLGKLHKECQRAKRTLKPLTKAKFEDLNMHLFTRTLELVKMTLEDSDCASWRGNRVPKIQQFVKDLFNGKEPKKDFNPDEAVAYGAAIQGGILNGEGGEETKEIVLLDVVTLRLRVHVLGGIMDKPILRNSTIPRRKMKTFFTVSDNQSIATVKVFQGESSLTKKCHLIGMSDSKGIRPAP
ncbi:Heat shock protein 70 family, partial [Dillenia turbinata]